MRYCVEMIPVSSSFIRAIGYDGFTLYVVMRTGQTYEYPRASHSLFLGLLRAPSKGAFYNRFVRIHPRLELSEEAEEDLT